MPVYVPKEQNVIQAILQGHFSDFEEQYDDHYAKQYGKYRIIRIKEAVEKFLECGDYSKGIARIKCTNHNCDHEYFRPFPSPAKHGTSARAVTRKESSSSLSIWQTMFSSNYLTGNTFGASLKHFVSTSEMTNPCLLISLK